MKVAALIMALGSCGAPVLDTPPDLPVPVLHAPPVPVGSEKDHYSQPVEQTPEQPPAVLEFGEFEDVPDIQTPTRLDVYYDPGKSFPAIAEHCHSRGGVVVDGGRPGFAGWHCEGVDY